MKLFHTFRGKLLVVLILLSIATLGIQFAINYYNEQVNIGIRDAQAQALMAGMALGTAGLTSEKARIVDLIDQPGQTFLDDVSRSRIRDVIIIDDKWRISDSINENYWPTEDESGELKYKNLSELTDLPPLMNGERLGPDLAKFPNVSTASKGGDEAHAVPIETSRGRWYVMVLLRNDSDAAWRAAWPLVATLIVLLASTLITFWLVWRFTRPIANLSIAAQRIAEGDLHVRVPGENRHEEMGQLATQFNKMTAELERNKELEDQLQVAEKSAVIGRLGSAIAHEIRNPLNYINLTLDHLRKKYAPADPGQHETFNKLTSQLKGEVARIDQQITDFLNYSRPPTGDLKPTDIRAVVDDSLRIIQVQADDVDVKVSVIEHEDVPPVLGDAEFLRSVFNNLYINAVHAMQATGGTLRTTISPDGRNFVAIEIADTGGGIPPENLAAIFEPYFSTKETGTGLGLAIVQRIIEQHNGTVSVDSKIGSGTKFTVRLPVASGERNIEAEVRV